MLEGFCQKFLNSSYYEEEKKWLILTWFDKMIEFVSSTPAL